MFASILKGTVKKGPTGWAAYWAEHPHNPKKTNQDSLESAQALHERYITQAAKTSGLSPIKQEDISHSPTKTTVKTANSYKLGQGVIDHLASQGFEHKDMVRNGTDSIYTMQHPKTKEKVKVGYFHGFGKTLSGNGMPSRVEISHMPKEHQGA